ncbi:MAG: hypothetical protein U0Q55_10150 [Vicinamibacterales bacterium]
MRALALALCLALLTLATPVAAADPLVGLWRLQKQEVNGQETSVDKLVLQISEAGDKLTFAFSVPLPDVYFVTATYTARLDGTSADIINGNDQKMGTIEIKRGGTGRYTLTMKGPNRPDSQGSLTLSADGKTLVSESTSAQGGRILTAKQTFARD